MPRALGEFLNLDYPDPDSTELPHTFEELRMNVGSGTGGGLVALSAVQESFDLEEGDKSTLRRAEDSERRPEFLWNI